MKAFSYLRVSGKSQTDGDGFPRQSEACEKYAAANGHQIVRVFEENAVSGRTELENRPAFLDMLAAIDAEDGGAIILIEKLDRLARDLMIQETIIADLRRRGVRLISVMEPDLLEDNPSRKMLRQFLGAIAEYDRAMIVGKLRAARQRKKAATGRCEGRKPYGSRAGESEVLATMQQMRQAGASGAKIAKHLNAMQIPSRNGKPWNPDVVNVILKRDPAWKQREIAA